ncbi:Macrophage mannose receptor 1 [Channa argus]|uniref:Macrophage mannose receptor 1 n=1 Tax=Channa argus TaxID=215402 RepID=A0A6G1Q8E5_CHAAH|nr:Macrophage mannose receptor 1 [Channa argus]
MQITHTISVVLIQIFQCLASNDSPFQLTSKATGFCLVKTNNQCNEIRWTTGDRLLVPQKNKCVGVQGKSVGSEIGLYDCDENSDLQKWECRNETLLALKGQELYIELTADNTAVLSKTLGPNNYIIISGTTSGACTRTYREIFTISGNAAGLPCMFPFFYENRWFSDCTTFDAENYLWCAVETKYQNGLWGCCPTNSKADWNTHPITGAYYQINKDSALTWPQADVSCKQQGASLLSITDPHQQAYVTALLGKGGNKIWTGLILDSEHGWKWSNGRPYRYMNWDSGHPLPNPGYNCALLDPAVQYSWQSLTCSKKLGYICYSEKPQETPTQAVHTSFCSSPWIPYNGHCFHLNRTQKRWPDAQRQCRSEGGDLVSIRNLEDQSFVISQLGYESTDELWIGLNDKKTEGLFEWSDHSTVSFTSWEYGKPAVSSDIQDCVVVTGENGNWADRICEDKHGFICMKMSASTPTGEEVEQDVGCKTEFYEHSSPKRTWYDARDYCRAIGGDLLSIHSSADLQALPQRNRRVWIGLSAPDPSAGYVWSDGSPLQFQHWEDGEPNNKNNVESCAEIKLYMSKRSGSWNDVHCETYHEWICQIRAGVTPKPPPDSVTPDYNKTSDGWLEWNGNQYYFNKKSMAMEEARTFCQQRHGDLVTINSEAESVFLWKQISQSYGSYWIGLIVDLDGTAAWIDGSSLVFQRWDENQPDFKNNDENCAAMTISMVFLSIEMAKAPTKDLWIGLHNSRGFQFYWTDGRPMRFHNWGTANNGCALMTTDTKIGIGKWIRRSCNDTNGYVCLRNLDPNLTDSPEPTTPIEYIKLFNDSIKVVTKQMNWEAARKHCKDDDDANLASIRNKWSQMYIELMALNLQASLWIGLNTNKTSGYFRYSDGWHLTISNWGPLEPRTDRSCVYVDLDGTWKTADCNDNRTVVCMKTTDVAPTEPSDFPGFCPDAETTRYSGHSTMWRPFKGYCYLFLTKVSEWPDASADCVRHGGTLASIEDPYEQSFIERNLKTFQDSHRAFWIGLYKTHKGVWQWLDKTVLDYTNWDVDVSRYSEYGLIQISDGKWRTGQRWEDRGCICKTPKVTPNTQIPTRGHIILAVMLVITATAIGTVILFLLFKRSGHHLRIPEKLTTFDNPLFFSNDRARPDLVDTEKLVANVEEENPGPLITA